LKQLKQNEDRIKDCSDQQEQMRKEIQKTHEKQKGMEEQKVELETKKEELGRQKKDAEDLLNRLFQEITMQNEHESKLQTDEKNEESKLTKEKLDV